MYKDCISMIHCDTRKSFIKYEATTKYFIKNNTAKKDTNANLQKDPALEPYFCLLFMFQKCFAQSAMVAEIPLTLLRQKYHRFFFVPQNKRKENAEVIIDHVSSYTAIL